MNTRSSRYILEGEVDPGMREMAETLLWRSQQHSLAGETADSTPLSELDTWLLALKLSAFDVALLDEKLGANEIWTRNDLDRALVAIKAEWPRARAAFEAMALPREVIDTLVFTYGDVGEAIPRAWQDQGLKNEQVVAHATALASSIPPLGRVFAQAFLERDGVVAAAAKKVANDLYPAFEYQCTSHCGTLMSLTQNYDRRKQVAATLRALDPKVSDAQIDRVARSPLTTEEISKVFSGAGAGTFSKKASSGGGGGAMIAVAAAVVLGLLVLRK